jgi:hypothetical protein
VSAATLVRDVKALAEKKTDAPRVAGSQSTLMGELGLTRTARPAMVSALSSTLPAPVVTKLASILSMAAGGRAVGLVARTSGWRTDGAACISREARTAAESASRIFTTEEFVEKRARIPEREVQSLERERGLCSNYSVLTRHID